MIQKTTKILLLLLASCTLNVAVFSQTNIAISSPNGGEIFSPGEVTDIDYLLENGEAGDDVMFYYSIDNGVSYTWIGDTYFSAPPGASYSGSYSWNIPLGINSTNCLIRTEVYRTPGGIGVVAQDTTDNVFAIHPPITAITLLSPNGGETYAPEETIDIDYLLENGAAGDDLSFYYSIDNGASFTWIGNTLLTIAPVAAHSGTYSWTIPPGINSTGCLIRTEVYRTPGGVGVVAQDTTDNRFNIYEDMLGLATNQTDQAVISLYPNPTKGKLSIDLGTKQSDIYIKIVNIQGKVVFNKEYFSASNLKVDFQGEKGIYFLEVHFGNSFTSQLKFTKD